MSNRKPTRVRAKPGKADRGLVETRDIPGGYPDLTASQLDLIRERSTEMVVDPARPWPTPGMSTMTSCWSPAA